MSREVDSDDDRLEIAEEPPSSQAMSLVKAGQEVSTAAPPLATTPQQAASTINFKLKRDPWQRHHTLPAVREVKSDVSSNADAVESLLLLSGMGSPPHSHPQPPDSVRPRASSMSFLQPTASSLSSSLSSLAPNAPSVNLSTSPSSSASTSSSTDQLMRQRASSMSLLSSSVRNAAANAAASRRYSSGGHGDSSGKGGGPDGDSSYYQRMRERNNEASKRCRLKRRMKTETMEYQANMLGKHNRWLKDRLSKMEGLKKALVGLQRDIKRGPDCQCTQTLKSIATKVSADYPEECNQTTRELLANSQSLREMKPNDHPGFAPASTASSHQSVHQGGFGLFGVDDVSEPNSPIRSRSNSNTATLLSGAAVAVAAGGKALPMMAQMDAVIPAAAPAAPQLPVIHTDVNQRIKTALNFVGRPGDPSATLSVTPLMKPPVPIQHKQLLPGLHSQAPPVILMPTAGSEQLAAASRQQQQQQPVRKPVTALDVLNETIVKSLKPATIVNEEKTHHAPPPPPPQQQLTPINLIKIDQTSGQPAAMPKQLVLVAAAPPQQIPSTAAHVNNPPGGEWKSVAPHTLNTCNQIFLQRPATAATDVYPAAAAVAPVQESATTAPSIVGHPHHQYHQQSPVRIVKSPPIGEIATSVAPPPNIGVSGSTRNSACVASKEYDNCSGDLIALNKLKGWVDLATRQPVTDREDGAAASEKAIIKSRLKIPFWVSDDQSSTYICEAHRRTLVMDRVMNCVICGKDRSGVPRGLKTKPLGVMMTITYGMSLQYHTMRGSILPVGSLVCGLCRDSHLTGIDLTHSKLVTRKPDNPISLAPTPTNCPPVTAAEASMGSSMVLNVLPTAVTNTEAAAAPSVVTSPSGKSGARPGNLIVQQKPPLVNSRGVEVMQVKPSMESRQMEESKSVGLSSSSSVSMSSSTAGAAATPETIFTKISKLNEALNAINPQYKPIGFSITSIESCSKSVLQDATMATETAISTLMSVIAPGNEAFLWKAIKPRLDDKLLKAGSNDANSSNVATNEDVEMITVKNELQDD